MLCSLIVALQWHRNRWPWMAMNDHLALKSVSGSATYELAVLDFGQNCPKIGRVTTYYQRQKCSPGILVSSKVRLIEIFAGVRWRGDVKWEWSRRKWRFSLLSLATCISSEPSHSRSQLLHCTMYCSPLVALHLHRNRWPWMTLNDHFALKSGSSSASNGLAFWLSDKTAREFAELRIYYQRQNGTGASIPPKTRTQPSPLFGLEGGSPPPLNHQDVDSLAPPRCFGLAHRIYIFCYQAVIMPVYWYFHLNFPENIALF